MLQAKRDKQVRENKAKYVLRIVTY